MKRLYDLYCNKLAPGVKGVFNETEKWDLPRFGAIEAQALQLIKNNNAAKVLIQPKKPVNPVVLSKNIIPVNKW